MITKLILENNKNMKNKEELAVYSEAYCFRNLTVKYVDIDDYIIDPSTEFAVGSFSFMKKCFGGVFPIFSYYPVQLSNYLNRYITKINPIDNKYVCSFCKPLEENIKDFNGCIVWNIDDNTKKFDNIPKNIEHKHYNELIKYNKPIYVSSILNFITEWRVYVMNGNIVHISRYDIYEDNTHNEIPIDEINNMINKLPKINTSYGLDVGLTNEHKFTLVEYHPGVCLGMYDCPRTIYFDFLLNFWNNYFN